ncbi:MAG: hypothetical protein GTN70_08825 [Deltaproteobacteria bacterium]|nr:hypothetical protein [Deltaproteobacteria bacterium]NIS77878.1 hypothetical protein [Deltaproteobacteria bacterium]
MRKLGGSLALRLTLWYAVIFTVSFLVTFLTCYLLLSSFFQRQLDRELRAEIAEEGEPLSVEPAFDAGPFYCLYKRLPRRLLSKGAPGGI